MSAEQTTIQEITFDDLTNPERLEHIYEAELDFYWSSDWSPEFYIELAKAGFISVAHDFGGMHLLLPQIQSAYAVLDWENLHASRSTRRWMRSAACLDQGYELSVGHDLFAVLDGIQTCHGDINWMTGRYLDLLPALLIREWEDFELMPIGLVNGFGELVAGEIGYRCGWIYTSLTGFSDRRHNHAGKLQLLRLGEFLREAGYAFWNLGHPYMQYKLDLGAIILKRTEFLERWQQGCGA